MLHLLAKVNDFASLSFQKVFNSNAIVTGLVQFIILLYISQLSPELPYFLKDMFSNVYFRLVVFTCIFMYSRIDMTTAILMSIAFIVSMNALNKRDLWEFMDDVDVLAETPAPESETASSIDGVIVAPSEPIADAQINASLQVPTLVTGETITQETIIVTPTVSADGVLTVPNVVVAPIAITNEAGKVKVVSPNLSVIDKTPGPETQQPFVPVQELPAPLVVKPTVVSLSDETVSNFATKLVREVKEMSCYPTRSYDLSKIVGAEDIPA